MPNYVLDGLMNEQQRIFPEGLVEIHDIKNNLISRVYFNE